MDAVPNLRDEPVEWPNNCGKTVPEALRYLADYGRPSGGQSHFNSEHLFQLAEEIEEMAAKPLYLAPQPQIANDAAAEALRILELLNTQNWKLTRHIDDPSLTDEANAEYQWSVERQRAPYCGKDGRRVWLGPTPAAAFASAQESLRKPWRDAD